MSPTEVLEPDVTDPGTLRAALARSELHRYELAARVKRDPSTLSQWLNGHKPIPADVGERILRECTKATRRPRRVVSGAMSRALLVTALLLVATPSWAARQTTGTQSLSSAATINLSGTNTISVCWWGWIDTYANTDQTFMELGNLDNGGFVVDPDDTAASWAADTYDSGASNLSFGTIARTPATAAAWHYYCVNYNRQTAGAVNVIAAIYVDGVSQSVSHTDANTPSPNFGNLTLWLMRTGDGAAVKFLTGRIAEVAIWTGINLSGTDVSTLYNHGTGTVATAVQNGSLSFYWKLCGTASPEPNTVGGVDMTVNSATQVAHPIVTCNTTTPCVIGGGIIGPGCVN